MLVSSTCTEMSPTPMNEYRDVCVEPPKTKLEQKGDKVAVPLPWSLLQTVDRLLQQDTISSSSSRRHCPVWNGHVALLLKWRMQKGSLHINGMEVQKVIVCDSHENANSIEGDS